MFFTLLKVAAVALMLLTAIHSVYRVSPYVQLLKAKRKHKTNSISINFVVKRRSIVYGVAKQTDTELKRSSGAYETDTSSVEVTCMARTN